MTNEKPKPVESVELHHTQIIEAKVRCLDALAGDDNTPADEFTDWEVNFIGDMKDRVDKLYIPLTNEQEAKLLEIWTKMLLLYPDLNYLDYVR